MRPAEIGGGAKGTAGKRTRNAVNNIQIYFSSTRIRQESGERAKENKNQIKS